jgi:polar amino acid transport system substrate-binding protein
LDRVKAAGKLALAYEIDARPFSFQDEKGKPAGYSIELCERVADAVKAELQLPSLNVEWVPIKLEDRLSTMQQNKADLLCGSVSETLTRRRDFGFSLPIFPSGIGGVLRVDAPAALINVLANGRPGPHPIWRGDPARITLQEKTFSVIAGATSEMWLANRLETLQLTAKAVPVATYADGIQRVLDGSSDVFFGDLPILDDVAKRSPSASDLLVLDRHFTYEPLALTMARGDEDFRLLVDRALSELYRSQDFRTLYAKWFGALDEPALTFFRQTALPE